MGRRLAGGIPRSSLDHRRPEGRTYAAYCRAVLDRFGSLPRHALPTLKAAGMVAVDLDRLAAELQRACGANRRRDQNRIRRQLVVLRTQLVALERRIEELDRPSDLARLFGGE